MIEATAKEGETLIPLTHYVGARGAAYSRKFYHTCKDMILRNADKLPIDTLVGYRWGEAQRNASLRGLARSQSTVSERSTRSIAARPLDARNDA